MLVAQMCKKMSTFAVRLLWGTLRTPRAMVLIVMRLAAQTVSESAFETIVF
jgi:hypothetical protein